MLFVCLPKYKNMHDLFGNWKDLCFCFLEKFFAFLKTNKYSLRFPRKNVCLPRFLQGLANKMTSNLNNLLYINCIFLNSKL